MLTLPYEIWRDIKGYENKYQVSNLGNVRSVDVIVNNRLFNGKVISQRFKGNNPDSYLTVNLKLNSNSKTKFVHRLVAEAFIPNTDNLPQVNHKDECKTNNHWDNLEWCSAQYNANYGTRNDKIMKSRIVSGYVNPDMIGLTRQEYMKKYKGNRYRENEN